MSENEICFGFSLTRNSDSLASDGGGAQNTSSQRTCFSVFVILRSATHICSSSAHALAPGSPPQDKSFCTHSPKHLIHTPCHSWVFHALSSFCSTPSTDLDTFSSDADWNQQTKPVRDSTIGRAVWPSDPHSQTQKIYLWWA